MDDRVIVDGGREAGERVARSLMAIARDGMEVQVFEDGEILNDAKEVGERGRNQSALNDRART